MTKKSDAPAIRFKGFSDAWEQRKLTEFVEFFSGLLIRLMMFRKMELLCFVHQM